MPATRSLGWQAVAEDITRASTAACLYAPFGEIRYAIDKTSSGRYRIRSCEL
jgi:hypothetical protein